MGLSPLLETTDTAAIMATSARAAETAGRAPSGEIVVANEADREREFRRAYRHSRVVRMLRYLLPISAIAMFASYGVSMRVVIGDENRRVTLTLG